MKMIPTDGTDDEDAVQRLLGQGLGPPGFRSAHSFTSFR